MKWNALLIFVISLMLVMLTSNCDENPYKQGKIMYNYFCANCHMEDGTGLEGNIPPLAQADYVKENQDKLACIIRYGQNEEIVVNGVTYNNPMAGIEELSDFEITNIINYINHSWGNDYGYMKYEDVKSSLEDCKPEY